MSTVAKPLAGKVALVTGASSGIGAATARELARRGARVVLAARREAELQAQARAIEEMGGQAMVITADMADAAQVRGLAERASEAYGRVDILVNVAGVGWTTPFDRVSYEEIVQMVNVNLLGAIVLTRSLLPAMLQRRQGAIITVASVAGHVPLTPLYSATKFGLRGFAHALRREVAGSGVAVSVISPGYIRTSMTKDRRQPMPGPELVARTIADLAVRPRRDVIVPRVYRAVVWLDRIAPWALDLAARLRRPGSA